MAERKRIQWSEAEQDTVYSSWLDLKDKEKLKLPPTVWTEMSKVMKVLNYAQQSLPTGRRRRLSGIVAIPPYLLKRLQDSNYLPRNMKPLQKGYKPEEDEEVSDPRNERIKVLEGELAARDQLNASLQEHLKELEERIQQLENQPTPMQLMQTFIADTLAMALVKAGDAGKPAGQRLPEVAQVKKDGPTEPLPDFERMRRKDPTYGLGGNGSRKPKFALIADFIGSDKAHIHKECSETAELRYLDSSNKFQGLKNFNANGGRIIVWTAHSPHDWEGVLQHMGVSFHRFGGTLPGLIAHIREVAKRK